MVVQTQAPALRSLLATLVGEILVPHPWPSMESRQLRAALQEVGGRGTDMSGP